MSRPVTKDEAHATISASHVDNEQALEMARAIRRAEIAVLGEAAAQQIPRLEPLLLRTGAKLVLAATPDTRFVVADESVPGEELLAATENGALLIQAEDVDVLITAYTAVWFPDGLQEATRKAREEARRLALVRAVTVRLKAQRRRSELVEERTARMQSRLGDAGSDSGATTRSRLSEAERMLEDRARSARQGDARTSLKRLI